MYKKILEALDSLIDWFLAAMILWQEICAVFFEEDEITDILECEIFEVCPF